MTCIYSLQEGRSSNTSIFKCDFCLLEEGFSLTALKKIGGHLYVCVRGGQERSGTQTTFGTFLFLSSSLILW